MPSKKPARPERKAPEPPDLNLEERRRRNAAIEQAWRIFDYLPILERRITDLEARRDALDDELRETRGHLEAERRAHGDLVFESMNDPGVIETRDRERAEAAA